MAWYNTSNENVLRSERHIKYVYEIGSYGNKRVTRQKKWGEIDHKGLDHLRTFKMDSLNALKIAELAFFYDLPRGIGEKPLICVLWTVFIVKALTIIVRR